MATVQDLIFGSGATASTAYAGVYNKLARRDDIVANPLAAADWIRKTIWELTQNFTFQELQVTAPKYTLTAGQSIYNYSDILGITTDYPTYFPSFYIFYDRLLSSGTTLKFKSIDSLELMLSTQGTPAYWSRFGNQIYIAPVPECNFVIRPRYQKKHPFPNLSQSPPAFTDTILMPDEWLDIVEYGAAERGANDLRMLDYAQEFHTMIFGDPEFERSSGARGNPGLIFRRTSQLEMDTTSQMRSIRVRS